MNLATKISGWLVALAWVACGAYCALFVHFFLFVCILSSGIPENWQEYRTEIIFLSLSGAAFLVAAAGVAMRRSWSKRLSLIICACADVLLLSALFFPQASWKLEPSGALALIVIGVSVAISGWLMSTGGQGYFQKVAQSE